MDKLKLDNQLCFRLYTASRLITQAYEPYFRPLGITYTQYLVLLVLWENDNVPINTIARRLALGINTMSPLVKRLETLGLVERTPSKEDKRVQFISLTQKGKDMEQEAAKIPDCMATMLGECGLDAESDLVPLIPLLDKVIEKLNNQ